MLDTCIQLAEVPRGPPTFGYLGDISKSHYGGDLNKQVHLFYVRFSYKHPPFTIAIVATCFFEQYKPFLKSFVCPKEQVVVVFFPLCCNQRHSTAFKQRQPDFICGYVTSLECQLSNRGALKLKGVTGLPANFPIQQKERLFCKAYFLILLNKTTKLIVNGEVIWQANDSV